MSASADAAMRNDSSSSNYSNSHQKQLQAETKKATSTTKTKEKIVDWRAWFSSSDYDDPWSAHRPFTHPQLFSNNDATTTTNMSNNSVKSTQNVVEDILSNYNEWEGRRHGMNLTPLTLHSQDGSIDILDTKSSSTTSNDGSTTTNYSNNSTTTTSNNNTLSSQTTNNNSNNEQIFQLQKRTQWIDTQTRFTIQLLNDLYDTGIRRQMDRPTTERCHRMIGRLLGLTPRGGGNFVTVVVDGNCTNGGGDDDSNKGNSAVMEIQGAAQRGKAILERMEWCCPVYLPHLKLLEREEMRQKASGVGGGGLEWLLVSNHKSSSSSSSSLSLEEESDREKVGGTRSSLQRYRDKVPQHLLQTKQVIPSPTRAIYNMVLLLYGKEERGSRHVAEQAEDIVWGMIVRGLQLEEFQKSHNVVVEMITNKVNDDDKDEESALLMPIYPTIQNWNCVLKCWSNSSDPNRAFFAYSFFKSWMEWNVNRSKVEGDVARCNLETFQLMIKSCVVDEFAVFDDDDDDDGTTTTNKTLLTHRAKEVGSRVAIGIWKDLRAWKDYSTENTLTSETYHQLLIALCQTSTTEPSRGSLAAVAAVFQSCRSDGMETKEITHIVRGVMTEAQCQKLMSS